MPLPNTFLDQLYREFLTGIVLNRVFGPELDFDGQVEGFPGRGLENVAGKLVGDFGDQQWAV